MIGVETRQIKSRLVAAYGDRLAFIQKKKGTPEFVYSTETSSDYNEQDILFMRDTEKVKAIATMIKDEISESGKNKFFSSWPPPEEEIKSERVLIPPTLATFLRTILTTDKPSNRLIKSIGQDIIYNCSSGRIKIVKHIQLGIVTKRKTGSKLLLNCLNRLGHSISYDDVNNIETSFAEAQANNKNHRSFVPNNVQPSTFVTFVYDNCDHNRETLSGVSMHCTNGILIQRRNTYQHEVDPIVLIPEPSKKRRSFKPINNEIEPYYPTKERMNPPAISEVDLNDNLMVELLSKKADFLWILSRYKSSEDEDKQRIPSWTGFYYEVMPE